MTIDLHSVFSRPITDDGLALFLARCEGRPVLRPFCELYSKLAGAVRREIGDTKDAITRKLKATGLAPNDAAQAADRLVVCCDKAAPCREVVKYWVPTEKSLCLFDRLEAELQEQQAWERSRPAALTTEALLAAMVTALRFLQSQGPVQLSSAEALYLQMAHSWLDDALCPYDVADYTDEAGKGLTCLVHACTASAEARRYSRDFCAMLTLNERRRVMDALFIMTTLLDQLMKEKAVCERVALAAAVKPEELAALAKAGRYFSELFCAFFEHMPMSGRLALAMPQTIEDLQAAGHELAKIYVRAARSVRGLSHRPADDACCGIGVFHRLASELTPDEMESFASVMDEVMQAQTLVVMQAFFEISTYFMQKARR